MGMTRAMNTLILTRAHYRRRYGNDAPEASIPSRFLEEVPPQLVENLGGRSPGVVHAGVWAGRGNRYGDDFEGRHYNYEDENQEVSHARGCTALFAEPQFCSEKRSSAAARADSIDNIARFFGGKMGGAARLLCATGDGHSRRQRRRRT